LYKKCIEYAKLFQVFKKYAAGPDNKDPNTYHVIERVTIWGIDDATSWRSEYGPLLFNSDLTPKEAFYAVLSTLMFKSTMLMVLQENSLFGVT